MLFCIVLLLILKINRYVCFYFITIRYGKLLDTHGPRQALHYTSLSCALVMLICGILVHILKQQSSEEETNILHWGLSLRKMVIWILFVFQHSYVQLLYSQYWSFLGTIMSASEGARYFSWIAGLSSISSTVAAASVSIAVKEFDLIGLLILSSISLFAATILGDLGYKTYEKVGNSHTLAANYVFILFETICMYLFLLL